MFSRTFKSAVLAAGIVTTATAATAEGYTTRIEPRPFYGATISIEEGVRVIRPLPPERQVIINPGGQTPLSLGFNETRVYEHSTIRNYLPEGSANDGRGYDYPRVIGGFGNLGIGRGFGPGFKKQFQRVPNQSLPVGP